MNHKVFVYGTLLPDEPNHHHAASHILHREPGTINGKMYEVSYYPAIVLTSENKIEGEWHTVTDEGLQIMNDIEGFMEEQHPDNLYERVWVKDIEKDLEGYVYTFTEQQTTSLREIVCGSWKQFCKEKE